MKNTSACRVLGLMAMLVGGCSGGADGGETEVPSGPGAEPAASASKDSFSLPGTGNWMARHGASTPAVGPSDGESGAATDPVNVVVTDFSTGESVADAAVCVMSLARSDCARTDAMGSASLNAFGTSVITIRSADHVRLQAFYTTTETVSEHPVWPLHDESSLRAIYGETGAIFDEESSTLVLEVLDRDVDVSSIELMRDGEVVDVESTFVAFPEGGGNLYFPGVPQGDWVVALSPDEHCALHAVGGAVDKATGDLVTVTTAATITYAGSVSCGE